MIGLDGDDFEIIVVAVTLCRDQQRRRCSHGLITRDSVIMTIRLGTR